MNIKRKISWPVPKDAKLLRKRARDPNAHARLADAIMFGGDHVTDRAERERRQQKLRNEAGVVYNAARDEYLEGIMNRDDALKAAERRLHENAIDPFERWKKYLRPSDEIDRQVDQLPSLFYEVSDAYQDALDELRGLEDRYTEVFKHSEARAFDVETGKKVTVAQAKAIAEQNPAVIKLTKKIRRAKLRVGKLDSMRDAFKQKASMLKAKVELIASQYIQKDHITPRTRAALPSNYGKSRTKY